ncbi:fumarylacetoacetate hydrolase family protein [Marinobacterium mangrovicola]|uniref:Fumarylacetoacetate (FAA) hydrolase n=1 Tax=Marinobacterium mangrovicola TaxID=1476959 RepID=A0A4R1GHE5_9GAMM|nr:fumarylacetoacetate hydrolase family protein [Marinobacterium mangrovicola]TCK07558.1 fumarylacetoacetate (FAA) hydrolase [Marinobacterium mangrovicola]
MKLATLNDGSRDGQLLVVSRDLSRAVKAQGVNTMQQLLENWSDFEPGLQQQYAQLNNGELSETLFFDPAQVMAPLPRTHQFVDGSAFLNHGNIMEQAFNLTIKNEDNRPIMIQRQGDDFRGPCEDYPFPSEADNGDFEGEVAVILDDTPMGVTPAEAESKVRLLVLMNDVSMRAHLFKEIQLGFGFLLAKPATVFGPVAVTPDELGEDWKEGRVHLDMNVSRNGEWFGNPNGGEMDFSFGELIAHLCYNRNLRAGMVLGSGTFSNEKYNKVGSACLAERRAIDVIECGEPKTDFLHFGERLRFEMFGRDGQSIFGAIDHRFVQADSKR